MSTSTNQAKTMDYISMELSLALSEEQPEDETTCSAEAEEDTDIEKNDQQQKRATPKAQPNNGSFYAKMALPYALFAIFYIVVRVSWLCLGYWWSRNSVPEIYGLREARVYSTKNKMVLNIHAFMGMTLIGILAWQYLSANFFASKYHERLRLSHRITGRILAALWPVVIILGFAHELTRYFNGPGSVSEVISIIASSAVGIASLVNLVVGYFAVAHRPQDKRNYLLHKAAMFFSMHYAIAFTLSIAFICAVQLAFPHCGIGPQGQVIGYFGGFVSQSILLFACMYKYAPSLLSTTIVKANAAVLLVHHVVFLVLLVGVFSIVEPVPGNCFA